MTSPYASPQDSRPGEYQPYRPAGYVCPKCGGTMPVVVRNGIQIEQCTNCRGVFLDFGELENMIEMETRTYQQRNQGDYAPKWASRENRRYDRRGIAGLFFSS